MWNGDNIIQIELGQWIINAANSPDNRNLITRWWNGPLESDIKYIVNGTRNVRAVLKKQNIKLPTIKYTDNNQIGAKEFIVYWGIECGHYKLDTVNDLLDFIYEKALEYDKFSIEGKDETTTSSICKDNFQKAYNLYVNAYYKAHMHNDFHTCSKCLTEIATITAQNGNMELALKFVYAAIAYAENQNVVDANLKCQCYYNAGILLKYCNTDEAVNLLTYCRKLSFKYGLSEYCFYVDLSLAEIYGFQKKYKMAIIHYRYAEQLVKDNNIASAIKTAMLCTYEELVKQMETQQLRPFNSQWTSIVQSILLFSLKQLMTSAASALIMKVFNLNGVSSIFSFGQTVRIEGNVFKSPICIGDYNKIYT